MGVDNSYKIDVEGLAAFQRALRAAGPEVVLALKAANFTAAQTIVDASIRSARSQGGVAAHAFVAGSIRAQAQQRNASITLNGGKRSAHPEILGAEFGSLRYHQFHSWRGNRYTPDLWDDGGAGYVLMPTIRAERERVLATYLEMVTGVLRFAFPDKIS